MFESQSPPEPTGARGLAAYVIRHAPSVGVGLLFIAIGATKFNGDPGGEWYHVFERIGIGQWFRVATGLIQVVGGMLMAAPQTRTYGASALAATMVGAAIVDVVVLGSPLVIVPLMLLFLLGAVWAAGV